MENNKSPDQKSLGTLLAGDEAVKDRFLHHFFSPVERYLADVDFAACEYDLDSIKIWLGEEMTNELLKMAYEKVKFCHVLLQNLSNREGDPHNQYSAFLSSPLEDHGLSKRLHTALRLNGCKSMWDVAALGKKQASKIRGVGKTLLEEITAVFLKHGCPGLFDKPPKQ